MATSELIQLLLWNTLSSDSSMQPPRNSVGRRNIYARSQTAAAPTSTICASSCQIWWNRLRMIYVSPLENVCLGSIASHEANRRH